MVVSLHLVLHMEQSWDELPPQPLVSLTDFTSPADFVPSADFATVTSVSLPRKLYQCMHTWVHMQRQLWILQNGK